MEGPYQQVIFGQRIIAQYCILVSEIEYLLKLFILLGGSIRPVEGSKSRWKILVEA